jgi:hypothetical protein
MPQQIIAEACCHFAPPTRGVLSLCAADTFLTNFQQIFAAFCVLMTESCISLFYFTSASKYHRLLIKDKTSIFRKSKQNRAKNLFLWRYSDTRISLRSKLYYKNNDSFQPLQT